MPTPRALPNYLSDTPARRCAGATPGNGYRCALPALGSIPLCLLCSSGLPFPTADNGAEVAAAVAERAVYADGATAEDTAPALEDDTVSAGGYRHLIGNGSAAIGWLTVCGWRTATDIPAERMPTLNVDCGGCLSAMAAADY